jgi:uncharacterized membrane protein YcaP (DUF421 family)
MDISWLSTSWTAIVMMIISTLSIYITLIILTRIAGLRSFSQMSGFDFAITISMGALFASTILTKKPPLLQSMAALFVLFILQMTVASLRGSTSLMSKLVNNEPLLLMKGTKILEKNLKKGKVTYADLHAKLREANVTQLSQVQAVVMETTGQISVLHNENPGHELDEVLLDSVRD